VAEEAGFDVLLTKDKNMCHQLNLEGRKIAVIALSNGAVYRIWYTCEVSKAQPKSRTESREQSGVPEKQGKSVPAIFYRTEAGGEPMREWLKGLSPEDRKRIGEDIKTVEFGWPIGMPVCKPMGGGVYEVRSSLAQNRIARVLFYVDKRAEWSCFTGSSRKRRRRRTRIWTWRGAIRLSIKGACNERTEKSQENGSQRVNLR
jgi:hypothetical protein